MATNQLRLRNRYCMVRSVLWNIKYPTLRAEPEGEGLRIGTEWLECCKSAVDAAAAKNESQRFSSFVTDDELLQLSKGFTPKNTSNSTNWAIRNFQAWEKARNTRFPDEKVPPNLLQTNDKSVVNAWRSRYVVETRNRDGSCYPPSTCINC